MTTAAQEQTHKSNIILAEAAKQVTLAAAKSAFNNSPAAYPAYAAAIVAADAAYIRSIVASASSNQMSDGPRQTLHELTGSWT